VKKKRITVVINNLGVGGAERMVYELLRKIDSEHFAVCVLCYMRKGSTPLEQYVENLFPITYLNHTGHVTFKAIIRVVYAIWKTNPDLVHAHLGGAGFSAIWAVLFRKPLIITVHTKPEKAFTEKIEMFIRMALRAGKTRLVAVSKENEDMVRKHYGLDAKKAQYVNNGIDLQRFYRKEHAGFTLINVARQDDNKNQAALLRCFQKLHAAHPETRLFLLGDGDNHEALKTQAVDLAVADAVTFTGNVINTEEYYAVSDLYVQCSFVEAMPMSVLEAMAAGLPVVATRVGGLGDVVKDNGILVPAGDEESLYKAIETVYYQNTAQKDAMRQASLRLVQAYSSTGMAREYEKIYNEMCE